MSDADPVYNSQAKKKSVNLSISSGLLEQAREQQINLTQTLERSLRELLRQKQRENWVTENNSAITEYNKCVNKDGVFSAGLRKF